MTPVSEAVERLTRCADYSDDETSVVVRADLRAILADHARLTEQVRVAREAMQDADRRLSRPDWTVQRDSARMKLRSALTLMEQNNGQ